VTAKELLKSVESVVLDFKKESGLKRDDDAITTLLSGLMVYCSENNLEFEDFCDVADKRFDLIEAELNNEEGESEEDDEEEEDEEEESEEEESEEEDEDEEEEEEEEDEFDGEDEEEEEDDDLEDEIEEVGGD
jgi:hypothetical protein